MVALIGQNAALGKEMLRTDISRTEKEKILLGLLQMQTAEANKLNAISKQLASTLYTRGYGPGLTTGKRRAYGHIPNYADPERAQAARGGYAAGSIRSMNMPGEGSVIYNSAETVKNFAGFKQPAIMPPQSSKAGKNYQQAFGSIHGFDPYAAGGFIPNFSLKMPFKRSKYSQKTDDLTIEEALQKGINKNTIRATFGDQAYQKALATTVTTTSQLKNTGAISLAAMLVPKEGYKFKAGDKAPYASYGTGKNKVTWPVYTLRPKIETSPKDLNEKVKGNFKSVGSKYASGISKMVNGNTVTGNQFWEEIERDRAGGAKGAWKAAVGAIFEAAVNAAVGYRAADRHPEQGDFDIRGGEINKIKEIFHGFPGGISVADYKSDSQSKKNRKSFRDKVLKEQMFRKSQLKNKARSAASGFVPNFADPLSDAIGREKAAGVPVSQIRVGSHGALMNRDNPLGLGVTNTYDEPNGLRDVFGANGFVPNYKKGFIRKGYKKLNKRFAKTSAGKILDSSAGQMGLALGLPMAAGATDNLAISGALQGAGTGAMIGSMFGPLGTAVGGAIGGLYGFVSGLNDAEEASKEKAAQDRKAATEAFSQTGLGILGGKLDPSQKLNGKTLLKTFESVPLHMGIAMQEIRESMKDFKGTTQEKIAEEKRLRSKIPYASREDLDRQKKSVLVSLMMGRENEVFRGREKLEKIGLKQETATGLEVMEAIKAANPEQIQKFFNDIKIQLQERAKSETDQNKAVILQLNTQKAIVDAQYASKMQQLEINAKYSSIVDSLTLQERVIGSSITEQQKANFTYTKAIQNAAKKYETGKETAEFGFRKSVLDFAKGGNVIAQLKTSLASGKSIDSGKINLNEELSNLTNQELSNAIAKLDLTDAEKLSLEQIVQARKRNLELLEKEKEIAEQRAKAEKYINDRIAKRNDIISKAKINLESRSSALSHTQTMRGLGMEVSGARRKADFGGGYKTHRQQADFALNESKINAQLKIRELQENNLLEIQRKKIDLKKLELEQEEMLDLYKKKEFEGGLNKDEETYYKGLAKDEEIRLETMKLITQEIDQQKEKTQAQITNAEKLLEIEKEISKENLKRAERLEAIQFSKTKAQYQDKISSDEFEVGQAQLRLSRGAGYISDFQRRRNALSDRSAREERGFALIEENARLEISQLKEERGYEKLMSEQSRYNELYSKLEEGKLFGEGMQEFSGLRDTLESRMEALKKIEEQSQMINSSKDSEIEKTRTLLNLEKQILEQEIAHKTGPGALGRGFDDSYQEMRDQVALMDYELGKKIPYAFADGLASAMTEALNGAKDLDDALGDAALNFLQMIQQAMMQKAAYSIVGGLGFSKGGNVRNYSRGGGVPAMVSNGEYVMNRDAVAKYGGSFMHSLNAGGKIPGFSNGGGVEQDLLAKGKIHRESNYTGPGAEGSAIAADFGGGRGFRSGRQYQRRAMSSFFYSQSGNIGLSEDTNAMGTILREEERIKQEEKAKREAKKAKRRQLIGSLIGIVAGAAINKFASSGPLTGTAKAAGYGANTPAGVNMAIDSNGMAVSTLPGANLAGSGFTNVTSTRSWNPMSWNSPSTINPALGPFFYDGRYFGGPIRKYASGGYISGKSGIDQIPAMLSEGEYVIRASSARQLGKPMLDRINAGKFNEGGAVSELMGSSETAASGGNTNNINISINMERGSGSKKENQSQDTSGKNPSDHSEDEQKNTALAERIKQQVVTVIMEEQRPGGLLSE